MKGMADQLYDKAFFDEITQASYRAAGLIVPHLIELVDPRSVVDLGCGRGAWLKAFQDAGVSDVAGFDGGEVGASDFLAGADRFSAFDLRGRVDLDRKFDLAMSLETAEHLPPERGESFVEDLVRLAPAVWFSAAIPRQGGTGHINERPQSYWTELFGRQGYAPIDEIRKRIWTNLDAGVVYAQNGILYVSDDLIDRNPTLGAWVAATDHRMIDVVHPKIYEMKNSYYLPEEAGIAQVVKSLPYALKATLNRRK